MGDRGNIVVRQGKDSTDDIWFYTHWSGNEIGNTVKSALARKDRWYDSSYLARIIFQELIGNDTGTTGFGISTSLGDNERDILVVDIPKQQVFTIKEANLVNARLPEKLTGGESFEDFIK